MLRSLYILLLFVSVTCQYSFAQITGSIFHDIDWNGRQTSNEESFEGVTIKAFGQNNVLLTQGKTDKLGKFNLPLTNNLSIRIEVESPNGFCVTSNNDISFIRSPNNLTVGLGSAAFFDSGKTRFVLPMYFVGNGQQRDNQKDSLDAVFSLLLRADGSYEKESLAKISEVGSVWGVAQAPRTDWIFVTALAKRHVAFGPLGVGGIYAINTKTKQVKPFVDLNRVGVQVGTVSDRGIKGEHRGLYRDSTLFSQVGKIGIGGIDASESAQKLYTVNLLEKTLVELDFDIKEFGPKLLSNQTYKLPASDCKGGQSRPFAVKWYQGSVYVGTVCDASESHKIANLTAYVHKFDCHTHQFTRVLECPLDYLRGKVLMGVDVNHWNFWTDDFNQAILPQSPSTVLNPQPILSDIEFDTDGSLLLAFMDRFGHQVGTGQPSPSGKGLYVGIAGGDLLRARPRRSKYELEHNAVVANLRTLGANNNEGPSGGEFYFGDNFLVSGDTIHQETIAGGIALNPATGTLIATSHEPSSTYNTSGVSQFDLYKGSLLKGYQLFNDSEAGTFSKTNAVGDVERVVSAPPVLIGNRVWMDCNENGLQDIDELPIGGIEVELWKNDSLLTQTITDSSGHYQFSSTLTPKLEYNGKYEVRIKRKQKFGYLFSTKIPTEFTNLNNRSIDANDYATIIIKNRSIAEAYNDADFGFKCIDKPKFQAYFSCLTNESGSYVAQAWIKETTAHSRIDLLEKNIYQDNLSAVKGITIKEPRKVWEALLTEGEEREVTIRLTNAFNCFTDQTLKMSAAGCESLSDTHLGIRLVPNPVDEQLQILWRSSSKFENIAITSASGQTVIQPTNPRVNGSLLIMNVSQLMPGKYILVGNLDGKRVSKSFIKK